MALLSSLIFAGSWGGLSDRIGRKKVLLIGTFSQLLDAGSIAAVFILKLPVVYLVPCKFISGMFGGYLLIIGVVHAMSCDALIMIARADEEEGAPKEREERRKSIWFSVLEAQVFIGQTVGPLAAGHTISAFGYTASLWANLGIAILAFAIATLLPESNPVRLLKSDRKIRFDICKTNTFSSLASLFVSRSGRCVLLTLAIPLATYVGTLFSFTQIFPAIAKSLDGSFRWTETQQGDFNAVFGAERAIFAMFLFRFVARCVGDITMLAASSLGLGFAFFFLGLASSYPALGGSWVPYVTILIGIPSCVVCPIIRSEYSRIAGKGKQGEVVSLFIFLECNSKYDVFFPALHRGSHRKSFWSHHTSGPLPVVSRDGFAQRYIWSRRCLSYTRPPSACGLRCFGLAKVAALSRERISR